LQQFDLNGFIKWYLNENWVGINSNVKHEELFDKGYEFEKFYKDRSSPDRKKDKLNKNYEKDLFNDDVNSDDPSL